MPGATPPVPARGTNVRPWWGLGDVALSIPVVFAFSVLGVAIAAIAIRAAGVDAGDIDSWPVWALVITVAAQQIGQWLWPWFVTRWKGLGMRLDWRLEFKAVDSLIGLGLAVACVICAGIASQLMSVIVGLEDPNSASNTSILTDNDQSLWVIGIIAAVVIGAPWSEELLFRGLVLRSFEKGYGKIAAVLGSTAVFTLPHFQDGASFDETMVLLSAIASIGLVLGMAAIKWNRLGPTIIGHMIFNAWGTYAALAL